mmetsp:Transcript_4245/g.8171  ORF Transcript_4245/g.8171 Transcript_4245/m.8171 type:complete len:232 (-) Transcript_4245:386-1081(-)
MLRPLRMNHNDLPTLRSKQRCRLRNCTLHIGKVMQRRAKNNRIKNHPIIIPTKVIRIKIISDKLASLPSPAIPRGTIPIHGSLDHFTAEIDPHVHVRFAQSRIDEGSYDGTVSASHIQHFSQCCYRPLLVATFRTLHGDGASFGNTLLQIGLHLIPHNIGLGGLGIGRCIPRNALVHIVQIQIGQAMLFHDTLQFLPILFGYLGLCSGNESIFIRGSHGCDEGVELSDRLV